MKKKTGFWNFLQALLSLFHTRYRILSPQSLDETHFLSFYFIFYFFTAIEAYLMLPSDSFDEGYENKQRWIFFPSGLLVAILLLFARIFGRNRWTWNVRILGCEPDIGKKTAVPTDTHIRLCVYTSVCCVVFSMYLKYVFAFLFFLERDIWVSLFNLYIYPRIREKSNILTFM